MQSCNKNAKNIFFRVNIVSAPGANHMFVWSFPHNYWHLHLLGHLFIHSVGQVLVTNREYVPLNFCPWLRPHGSRLVTVRHYCVYWTFLWMNSNFYFMWQEIRNIQPLAYNISSTAALSSQDNSVVTPIHWRVYLLVRCLLHSTSSPIMPASMGSHCKRACEASGPAVARKLLEGQTL